MHGHKLRHDLRRDHHQPEVRLRVGRARNTTNKEIGFDAPEKGLDYKTHRFINNIHAKLCEINASVSGRGQKPNEVGAGDQGHMFGYLAAAAGLVCHRAPASWPSSWRACVFMYLATYYFFQKNVFLVRA